VLSASNFFAYFLFFSALIVTIRSDWETMLISRFMTLYLIPLALAAAFLGYLPLSPTESIVGACFGYGFLYSIDMLFYYIRGIRGIGEGDFELLAFVGACTGPLGLWFAVLCGSLLGLVGAVGIMVFHGSFDVQKKIPFGPFLSVGAIAWVLWRQNIMALFL
jgi:leader peptidase (prepilin peptidase) / N-methyltransferase